MSAGRFNPSKFHTNWATGIAKLAGVIGESVPPQIGNQPPKNCKPAVIPNASRPDPSTQHAPAIHGHILSDCRFRCSAASCAQLDRPQPAAIALPEHAHPVANQPEAWVAARRSAGASPLLAPHADPAVKVTPQVLATTPKH